jgi:hypothetical protein
MGIGGPAAMLMLRKPATQSRLNAAVMETIDLRISGSVGIPGEWDMQDTMQYIESKTKRTLEACRNEFSVDDKRVLFTPFCVVIQTVERDDSSDGTPSPT